MKTFKMNAKCPNCHTVNVVEFPWGGEVLFSNLPDGFGCSYCGLAKPYAGDNLCRRYWEFSTYDDPRLRLGMGMQNVPYIPKDGERP
jgi:hypothetical protein